MKFSVIKTLAMGVVLVCSSAYAQDTPATTTSTATTNNAAAQDASSQATIYVYRYKQFVGSALSPSVYCDETELARMENGRFFVVKLPAGKHVFRSNDKQSGVEEDLKGGQIYYIRVELVPGMMKGHGRLISVAPEQGSYEIKKLKQLDSDKVKDTQHVVAANM